MNVHELKIELVIKWGSLNKPNIFEHGPRLCEFISFKNLDKDAKLFLCMLMMKASSPWIGRCMSDGDVQWLIGSIAEEIFVSSGNPDRRIAPLKVAFKMIAQSTGDELALLTPYLLAETEYLIRVNSKYVDYQGTILRKIPKHILKNSKVGGRINQVHLVYKTLLFRNKSLLASELRKLDKFLGQFYLTANDGKQMKLKGSVTGKFVKVQGVADRLKHTRNAIMHGEMPFINSEAFFYALLISIFFYSREG